MKTDPTDTPAMSPLRAERLLAGLSLRALARAVGTHPGHLARCELGERVAGTELRQRIGVVLRERRADLRRIATSHSRRERSPTASTSPRSS